MIARKEAYGTAYEFLDFGSYKNVVRWADELSARTPVQRGIRINRIGEGYVRDRHQAIDVDAVM